MAKEIVVNVTAEDILDGLRGSCTCCPIAQALWRTGDYERVYVSYKIIRLDGRVYEPPAEAQDFIDAFDMGEPVEPVSFVLRP